MQTKQELASSLIQTFLFHKKQKFFYGMPKTDLKPSETAVLGCLDVDKLLRPRDISGFLGVSPASVSPLLASLEEQGLIERIINPQNRREIFLQLTPKGKELAQKIKTHMRNRVQDLVEYLGEEQTLELIRLLQLVNQFVSKQESSK